MSATLVLKKKISYAKGLSNGVRYYYQGTVPEQFHIKEAMKLDSSNGDYWREFGTSRVKRGLAAEMQYYYGMGQNLNPNPGRDFVATSTSISIAIINAPLMIST